MLSDSSQLPSISYVDCPELLDTVPQTILSFYLKDLGVSVSLTVSPDVMFLPVTVPSESKYMVPIIKFCTSNVGFVI